MATNTTRQAQAPRRPEPGRKAQAADLEDTLETAPVMVPRARKSPEAVSAPVFVDASGRRRLWIRRAAVGVSGVLCAYGVAVALSFLGGPMPPGALLPIPGIPNGSAPKSSMASAGAAAKGATPSGRAGTTAAPGSALKTPSASSVPSAGLSPMPSASPSPTGHKPTVPPGQVSKSATPSATGHRH